MKELDMWIHSKDIIGFYVTLCLQQNLLQKALELYKEDLELAITNNQRSS